MATIDELKSYYIKNVENKVFLKLEVISTKKYSIMFLHDLVDEKKKFVDTFTQYFPYYVGTEEILQFIDISKNEEENLLKCSKMCWDWPTVPKRKVSANGIYGELFLDFYERIVKDRKLITTFASRREYSNNDEAKGYDHISYIINNSKIEVVLGEAKFVNTIYSAKSNLLEDVDGSSEKDGHLTVEYLNGFMNFVVLSNKPFSTVEQTELKQFFYDLNKKLYEGGTFLEYIIEKKIKINVVLFAVYTDNRFNPSSIEAYYDDLYMSAEKALISMGIDSFDIEIVFIPTKNKSMDLKKEIYNFYE